jgi:2-keto-3-deoxy-L-rhamnonate aldolase RhmA
MSVRLILALVALTLVTGPVVAQGPGPKRVNRVVELLQQKKPVFGLYAPSNRRMRPGGPGAAAPAPEAPAKTPAVRHAHPLIVKTPEMDAPTIAADIGTQLNLGVSGLMFPKAESAEQVRKGIAAMRFASKGGTRAETVGTAPAYWGLSEQDYKKKADVWPLNPEGELINWTIIESKEGLARVREIAAVKGIGVLWPGAGTLRGIFSKTNEKGERVLDEPAWEAAIQQVLSACKEFNVPCGFPANANDIELRMKQGFSVFVMNWGDAGFKTIDIGRRTATSTASK